MRIAVTTPTGNVGRHLVRVLVRGGARPLLLMRRPDALDPDLREHVDVVRADSFDPDDVVAATRDVNALYWVDPPATSADPLDDYALATEAVVAAVRHGVRRVVLQSSVGAELRTGAGEIDGLAATEVALDALDADVTHLRCGYFFTNLLPQVDDLRAGRVQVVTPVDAAMPWVAPRDIADVAASLLLNPDWRGRRVQAVHGPADLTWRQVAAVISGMTGRPLEVEQIPDEDMYRRYLDVGMPPATAHALLGMSTGLRDGFVPEQPRSAVTTTPTTLTAWAHDELAGRLRAGDGDPAARE